MNFEHILRNGAQWPLARCTPGDSGIPQRELDDHYKMRKTVNRLWFVHRAGHATDPTFPVVVVITSDGFMNVGGAHLPLLQGAATRFGFIHDPFTPSDYLQHIDHIDITVINDNILLVTFDIHSEAGEGVLQVELHWNEASQQPELHLRSAHVLRLNLPTSTLNMGFAGFNFMRGPTLHGLHFDLHDTLDIRDGGIEAFHDGRTLFVDQPTGPVIRKLLTPQVSTDPPVLEDIATQVMMGTRLVLDQPQHIPAYFSRLPQHPHYEHRTDLILSIVQSSTEPMRVRGAQIPADLQDSNPEAKETVNVYYAVDMTKDVLYDFEYTLTLAAQDFEEQYTDRQLGFIFISDREEGHGKLFYRPLDQQYRPAG
ncbi:MAG: hypothetical protein OEU26_18815, partial [Candidatus Tectomicrobia bacterium]|nr:hypothetical protein [Candidatus Tectomicrobia bacterium]